MELPQALDTVLAAARAFADYLVMQDGYQAAYEAEAAEIRKACDLLEQAALNVPLPAVFVLDHETGEADGTVYPFCTEECRDLYLRIPRPYTALGHCSVDDFGFTPKCEECGEFVGPETSP